jgi:hypothetical protein
MKEPLEQKIREDLECEITELKRQLVEAYEMIRKLSEEIEELQRTGRRQAVPFARRDEQRVKKPRKRGRKPGKGQFKNRRKPKDAWKLLSTTELQFHHHSENPGFVYSLP